MAAPLVIGIDLGTTNCAVACADAGHAEDRAPVHVVPVMQLVEPAETDRRPLLPSFLYIPSEVDFPADSMRLPWDGQPGLVIGELARRRGAENPSRLVASAKSWLSSGGANRTAPILPWGAPAEIPHLSPVEASAACLRHIAAAFDHDQPGSAGGRRLAEQDVLVTVPASFDEEARELTLQAARAAGFGQVTLLEEPQAAFYAWIDALGERWRRRVSVGDLILVCDVGGGTTDFSLIAVGARDGELALERVAVGDHILLGGDNMDLALARLMQQRLEAAGHRIDTWQLHGLWHQCRAAKETLLSDDDLQEHPVTVLGRGTRLIGGTLTTTLTRDDLDRVLLDGFFPVVSSADMPARARRVGLQELGLPYAADAAVTKHLARFLSRQGGGADATAIRRGAGGLACPTHVLFNGGVMKAPAVRARIVNVLDGWLRDEGLEGVVVLEAADLDHAVARGAAYYGLARRGRGVRIRSGAARSYYVGIESAMPAVPGLPAPLKALCVVPFGMEEGTSVSMPGPELGLIVGEPAEFRFLSSSVRRQDPAGALIEDWGDDLEELSPLEVTLERPGAADLTVPVTLESHVNEVGTLELWCVARDGSGERWKLELNIRERDPD